MAVDEVSLEAIADRIKQNSKLSDDETTVIAQYSKIFNPSHLPDLTAEEFKSFLLMRNNRHWSGIFRSGNLLTQNMDKLRAALLILLDETRPLDKRLNTLFPPKKSNYIKGMGKAIATPILLVTYPDKYGVWNSPSQHALEILNLLPKFTRGSGFAEKYSKINTILGNIKDRYGLSFWQTDTMMGEIAGSSGSPLSSQNEEDLSEVNASKVDRDTADFGLEKHLEDFIIDNWQLTDLGKRYDLIEEDGDIISQQFPTEVGPIDILARNKSMGEWLVIELKKGLPSDKVVGQTLRYMGWVKENKCLNNETVTGLIIAKDLDSRLHYSVSMVNNLSLMTYSVNFALKKPGSNA
jgi:hypothetical protein